MRILISIFFLFLSNIAQADCQIYPRLSDGECKELMTIQKNYYKYDEKMAEIALIRATEIKQSLLSNEEKVDTILSNIENTSADQIPIKIINDVIGQWKVYLNLTTEIKKDLIKHSLDIKNEERLEGSIAFIENKIFFITPMIATDSSNRKY